MPIALDTLHWRRTAPEITGEEGSLPARAEVVIVGGGYVGGATAYFLAKQGVRPLLIERRGISAGATGRNAGFVAPGLGMAFVEGVRRYGLDGAIERLQFTRRGRDLALSLINELAIDCDLEAQGGLTIGSSPDEWATLQESGAALQKAGFPFAILGPQALREHFHTDLPGRFQGALFNPETLLVNPAKLNAGITRAALRLGARLFLQTEVFALSDLPGGRIAVETGRGEVSAGRVVLATNAWSPLLAGYFKDRIRPARGQVFATAPAPPVFRRAMSTNYGYEYWSQRADGSIVLGGARWAAADRDEGYYAEELNPTVQQALYDFLTGCFPVLRGVGIARRWSGIMGFSVDGYPFIGALPGRESLIVAAGFTGHGGPYFAIAGRCVADLIATGHADPALRFYDPGRRVDGEQ